MNGILNVLKPPEMTSFDVVAHLRGLFGIKKIGHAGTLDPLAVGVLPVCIGRATRAIEFLMDKDKLYRAELTLGIATDTQDSSGKVISSVAPECSDKDIQAAVSSFTGKYLQKPPMYSALKVDGKRLYDLARAGIEIERQQREVEVYSSRVLAVDRTEGIKVLLDVHCSKGTYIRTLCADIGEHLGCGGHMSFLLRERAGPFNISDAFTLEELAQRQRDGALKDTLLGVDTIFENIPGCELDENSDKKFRNGMLVSVSHIIGSNEGSKDSVADSSKDSIKNNSKDSIQNNCNDGSIIRVYGVKGEFIALGDVRKNGDEIYLKVKKFF